MKILVTGAAGFIGFHLVKVLCDAGHHVVGIDNINVYYDTDLKFNRLKEIGIDRGSAKNYNQPSISEIYEDLLFVKLNLEDREKLPLLFKEQDFDLVCNLAAQAGVRYSIENPEAYVDSNLTGFANLLECCRNYGVKRLIYASSSSVYGENKKIPFSTDDRVDHPISLYAATKKSNELMAHTYSHLYDMETIGLRFFTVYGPWGRPDMAMFLFADAITKGEAIKVFNSGNLERDFTYIDDIIKGIVQVVKKKQIGGKNNFHLYNIGNSQPVKLLDFIQEIERQLDLKAQKILLPMQPGDVERTWADITSFKKEFGYNPSTSISQGVENFINWYKNYY